MVRSMRAINEIIVHCADTPEGRDVKAAEIKRWHTEAPPNGNGWKDIGYHYVIDLDGTIEAGRDLDVAGAHCSGHNAKSIGICYVGGADKNMKPKDTRTEAQKASLVLLLKYLRSRFPNAKIYGHRDFSSKQCPCFNAKEEYKNI